MEKDLSKKSAKNPELAEDIIRGIYVFRNGIREARLNGNVIDLYFRDGTYDYSEPVTFKHQGDTTEIIDVSGNKIATIDKPTDQSS